MDMTMLVDDIALTLYSEVSPRAAAHMIECFGSAAEIFAASHEELVEVAGLNPALASLIVQKAYHKSAEKEVKFLRGGGYKAVVATSDQYPQLLGECGDHPHVLYVDGETDIFNRPMLSMVGTREITTYGQVMCDVLIGALAERMPDLVIVSGLAYGIDIACHRAALKYGLQTIGVMATPLHRIYPSHHTDIAREMIAKGGAIITETFSEGEVGKHSFPVRNRIVAGMSLGTVVVESPLKGGKGESKGGSLITADLAVGYARNVMAVPGRANDWFSSGTNMLIKTTKAQMVCSAQDIINEMGWETEFVKVAEEHKDKIAGLSGVQREIMMCFNEKEVWNEYELTQKCGISYPDLCEVMFVLECNNLVKAIHGGKYEKI